MISASFIFDILRMLATAERPLGPSEISRRLKMPLSTIYRGITTLEEAGYAERHPGSNLFTIGRMGAPLVQRYLSRFAIRDVAAPFLRQLTTITGDTTALFVRIGWYYVRIAHIHGTNEIIQTRPLGEVRDLDDGVAGRIMLANLPQDLRDRYFGEFKPEMPFVERKRLVHHLEQIQATGIATEPSPTHPERLSPAFAIASATGLLFGTVCIEGGALGSPETPEEIEPLRTSIAELSALCSATAEKFSNPYDHLSPSSILLPSASAR